MEEGRQGKRSPPTLLPQAVAKRSASNATVSALSTAWNKKVHAQQAQLDADARLQAANVEVIRRCAMLTKARWKQVLGKPYWQTLTKLEVALRDNLYAESFNIASSMEINALVAGKRPAGAVTRLYRFPLKKANAPMDEMLIVDCVMLRPKPDNNGEIALDELDSQLEVEYRTQRMLLSDPAGMRVFFRYILQGDDVALASLSAESMDTLFNHLLQCMARTVVDMAHCLNATFFPCDTYWVHEMGLYYNWTFTHLRVLKLATLPAPVPPPPNGDADDDDDDDE